MVSYIQLFTKILFWPLLVFVSAMAWLPVRNPALTQQHPDKLNHIAAFVVLTVMLYLGYPEIRIAHVVLLMFAYGLLIEVVQYLLAYRHFSTGDILADAVGITLGVAIIAIGHWLVRGLPGLN